MQISQPRIRTENESGRVERAVTWTSFRRDEPRYRRTKLAELVDKKRSQLCVIDFRIITKHRYDVSPL